MVCNQILSIKYRYEHYHFDFSHRWSIYERNQSDNAHSDTLYLGFGYIPTDNIEYAMTLDNDKASLSYKRDLNGFDIRMSSNYSLMSQIPEYGAILEIVNTF